MIVGIGAFATHPEGTSAEELGLVKPSSPGATDRTAMMPTADDLLYAEQMSRFGPTRTWHTARTGNNTTGTGINTVCQEDRFADPKGYAALVRSFRASGKPERRAVQTVEVSRSRQAAARAFRTTVGWYAGCQVARLQVVDAYHVDHVGDQADVLTLRVGRTPRPDHQRRRRPGRVGHHLDGRHLRRGHPAAGHGGHPLPRRGRREALRAHRVAGLRRKADLPRRAPAADG